MRPSRAQEGVRGRPVVGGHGGVGRQPGGRRGGGQDGIISPPAAAGGTRGGRGGRPAHFARLQRAGEDQHRGVDPVAPGGQEGVEALGPGGGGQLEGGGQAAVPVEGLGGEHLLLEGKRAVVERGGRVHPPADAGAGGAQFPAVVGLHLGRGPGPIGDGFQAPDEVEVVGHRGGFWSAAAGPSGRRLALPGRSRRAAPRELAGPRAGTGPVDSAAPATRRQARGLRLHPARRGVEGAPHRLHGGAGLPGGAGVRGADAGGGRPLLPPADPRGPEGRGPPPRPVEPLPPRRALRGGPVGPGVRPAGRDQRAQPLAGAGGHELLGPRHREHGDPGDVRHARSSSSAGWCPSSMGRSAPASR